MCADGAHNEMKRNRNKSERQRVDKIIRNEMKEEEVGKGVRGGIEAETKKKKKKKVKQQRENLKVISKCSFAYHLSPVWLVFRRAFRTHTRAEQRLDTAYISNCSQANKNGTLTEELGREQKRRREWGKCIQKDRRNIYDFSSISHQKNIYDTLIRYEIWRRSRLSTFTPKQTHFFLFFVFVFALAIFIWYILMNCFVHFTDFNLRIL